MLIAEGRFLSTTEPPWQPVSFVIPAHNEAKCLQRTIESIQAAALEAEIRWEIIVVNDASVDATAEIAQGLGAKVVDVSLRNIGAVRNAGAKEAQYDWIFFVDADTLLPPATLAAALKALAAGAVGGGARVDLDDYDLFWVKRLMYYSVVMAWLVLGRWAAGCFMFCRREAFESFGGFDESYFAAEELWFSVQLKQRGRFQLVREPVVTSARKLQRYSTWQLLRFVTSPLWSFTKPLQTRQGLDILYQDQRA